MSNAAPYDKKRAKKATGVIRDALKAGRMIRPSICSRCNAEPPPGRDGRSMIQGHHYKGYDFPLDVEWLCTKCHSSERPGNGRTFPPRKPAVKKSLKTGFDFSVPLRGAGEILARVTPNIYPEPSCGCWIWGGVVKRRRGYGVTRIVGRKVLMHRLMYAIHKGIIPEGMLVCHRCDFPPCCNPDHLFLGTFTDNSRDCIQKKRAMQFTKPEILVKTGQIMGSFSRKLTAQQIEEIRESDLPYKTLANMYGVSVDTICLRRHTDYRPIPIERELQIAPRRKMVGMS